MSTPPVTPIAKLAGARDAARRMRTEWLLAVATGMVELDDLIREAATERGRPLLKISLSQALMSMPGVGKQKKNQLLHLMSNSVGERILDEKLSISSLVDGRVGGRVYYSLNDARRMRDTPVAGFPFTSLDESLSSETGARA